MIEIFANRGPPTVNNLSQRPGSATPGILLGRHLNLWDNFTIMDVPTAGSDSPDSFRGVGHLLRATLLVAVGTLAVGGVWAQSEDIGTVKTTSGSVEIRRGAQAVRAEAGSAVRRGDVVKTAAASTVGITLRDGTLLSAGPNSDLVLDKFRFDAVTQKGEMEATLKKGSLAGISGAVVKNSPDAVKFKTSSITLGVRGTSFIVEAADRGP